MNDVVYVGISEYKLLAGRGTLACSALGSCVGVCVHDTQTKLTGLLHILLPTDSDSTVRTNPAKFADSGVEALVRQMVLRGCDARNLEAKLVGGASLFYNEKPVSQSDIGKRNADSARQTLDRLGIPIKAEHVGGKYARSIKLDSATFEVRVMVLSKGVAVI